MKKGFDKKAQLHSVLWVIMEIALVAVIFLAFSIKLADINDDVLFDKIYLSKDLGLMTTAIYAAPGDVSYVYSGRIKNFSSSFDGGKVSIFYKELANPVSFPYVSDSNLETDIQYTYLTVINKSDVNFNKVKDSLEISGGDKKFVSDKLGCNEALNTKFRKEKQGLVLDPAYKDPFFNEEANITWKLANSAKLLIVPDPVFMTRQDNVAVSESLRLKVTENKAFSISLMLGEEQDVSIYMRDDSLENKKLACLLINELSSMEELNKGSIGISTSSFVENSKADVSVEIVFSKAFPHNNATKRNEFAKKIRSAVGDYYE